MDERQWCSRVHDYLATGELGGGGPCPMRNGNLCRLTAEAPCLSDEPETSQGWQAARRWVRYRTPEGKHVLIARKDVENCEELRVAGFLVGADEQLPIAVVKEEAAQS